MAQSVGVRGLAASCGLSLHLARPLAHPSSFRTGLASLHTVGRFGLSYRSQLAHVQRRHASLKNSSSEEHTPQLDNARQYDNCSTPQRGQNSTDEKSDQSSTHRQEHKSGATHPPSPFDNFDERVTALRSRLSAVRAAIAARAQKRMQIMMSRISELALQVNAVTGYEEVERRKLQVTNMEDRLRALRLASKVAKDAYEDAVALRSSSQRDVNLLLERKHSWTDADVSRFTNLVRTDHSSSQAVVTTSAELKDAEAAVDSAFTQLTQAILERYHEEQVWSDKIRSVSTWANLVGLAINLVVFVGAIAIVEPWKRRRLVERLEAQTAGLVQRVDQGLAALAEQLHRPVVVDDSVAPSDVLSALGGVPSSPIRSSGQVAPNDTVITGWRIAATAPGVWLIQRLDRLWSPSLDRDLALVAAGGALVGTLGTMLVTYIVRGVA